jgi:hypothetical protein
MLQRSEWRLEQVNVALSGRSALKYMPEEWFENYKYAWVYDRGLLDSSSSGLALSAERARL